MFTLFTKIQLVIRNCFSWLNLKAFCKESIKRMFYNFLCVIIYCFVFLKLFINEVEIKSACHDISCERLIEVEYFKLRYHGVMPTM